jgi:hypothetical protein
MASYGDPLIPWTTSDHGAVRQLLREAAAEIASLRASVAAATELGEIWLSCAEHMAPSGTSMDPDLFDDYSPQSVSHIVEEETLRTAAIELLDAMAAGKATRPGAPFNPASPSPADGVPDGATWLDEVAPGWHLHVDTVSLDATSPTANVLSQAARALPTAGLAPPEIWEIEHGQGHEAWIAGRLGVQVPELGWGFHTWIDDPGHVVAINTAWRGQVASRRRPVDEIRAARSGTST